MEAKVLIIPDVHGRTFWKDAINKFPKNIYPNLLIIFLGDYLDPYTGFEKITKENAYDNFIEILDYADTDERVIMLIGNHDWHYFVNCDSCRIDYLRSRKIEKLFINNINKFKLVHEFKNNDTQYLFTHAGISKGWLKSISDMAKYEVSHWKTTKQFPDKENDPKYIWINQISNICLSNDYNILNECLYNYDDTFYSCIPSMISRSRGGTYWDGSLIWADVSEHFTNDHIDEYYQIFSHSLGSPSVDEVYITDNFAMLDNRHAWVINDDNTLKQI